MAPFDSDYLSEIHEVMNGFKILLQGSPSKALVGQQFDLRVKKALLGQDGKEKALVQKVKQLEVAVMELQEGIIAREKAEQEAALKVKAEKERAEKEAAVKVKPEKKKVEKEAALKVMPEKKMRVEEDRAANSREFSERIGDEGDESYNEYWARKERAAFKRKLVERNDGDDEVWASKKRSAFRRKFAETETVNDEERLTKVFNEVQWMVKQNPGCKSFLNVHLSAFPIVRHNRIYETYTQQPFPNEEHEILINLNRHGKDTNWYRFRRDPQFDGMSAIEKTRQHSVPGGD